MSGASACPVKGLAWTGRCRGMSVALLQSKGRVPISAGELVLFCQILNQEACCFLAHDSLTYLAIARPWHPQPGWAVWREGPGKKRVVVIWFKSWERDLGSRLV